MKTILLAACLWLTAAETQAQYRRIEFQAAGLTCSMCSNAIYKSLKTLDFVGDVATDLSKNVFSITLKDGAQPDFDAIKFKVKAAGFSIANLSFEANFNDLAVGADTHTTLGNKVLHFVGTPKKTLSGWQRLQLVDKDFVLPKQYAKYEKLTTMSCIKTGFAQGCCSMSNMKPGERIFHVII